MSQINDDDNIISYYAVGNSLDGQPLIDTKNSLRFFPVYQFRNKMQKVNVRVYVGSTIWDRNAIKSEDGSFWQAGLPDFKLGEAIQRLEVETQMIFGLYENDGYNSDNKLKNYIELINRSQNNLINSENEFTNLSEEVTNKFKNKSEGISSQLDQILLSLKEIQNDNSNNKKRKEFNQNIENDLNKLKSDLENKVIIPLKNEIEKPDSENNSSLDTLLTEVNNNVKFIKSDLEELSKKNFYDGEASILKDNIEKMKNVLNEINSSFGNLIGNNSLKFADKIAENINKLQNSKDSLRNYIFQEITSQLTDSNLSGPSIRKSDIVIKIDNNNNIIVNMLYRNYKTTLRQLPALDPAERLGIFRVRYIPFPVVGNKLYRPLTDNSLAVFEIGIGFGDVAVTGDEFIKPTLSFDRLGVAFAISNKLFDSSAQIVALALTYDFNVYGSIGAGVNFIDPEGNQKLKTYFSFGINKKAFEFLVVNIAKIFN